MTKITIEWGHRYGRPFGFREIAAAMKKVASGEWEKVSENSWKVRGPKGGLQHGREARFLIK